MLSAAAVKTFGRRINWRRERIISSMGKAALGD
jgi:hypothetical protein